MDYPVNFIVIDYVLPFDIAIMTDLEKIRIRQLDDKSDYGLWCIRVKATIGAKGYSGTLDSDMVRDVSDEMKLHASNIIVSTLNDQALRVVRSEIGQPLDMLTKLDIRYDSKSTATRIFKMSELVSMRYVSLRSDMSTHVYKMAGLIEQLLAMGTSFDDALAVGILVASIDVTELSPVTASIETLSNDKITWEAVSTRLIEEVHTLTLATGSAARSNAANIEKLQCHIWQKLNHSTDNCFLNPFGKMSKIDVPDNLLSNLLDGRPAGSTRPKKGNRGRGRGGRRPQECSAMANGDLLSSEEKADIMMLDSGTTSHLTPFAGRVQSKKSSSLILILADDSKMKSTHTGTRKVSLCGDGEVRAVSLSNTLVVPDAGMSLMSVPALVKKNIAVLFRPGYAVLFDLLDSNVVL